MSKTMKINVKTYEYDYEINGVIKRQVRVIEDTDMEIKREGGKFGDILRAFPGWTKTCIHGNEMRLHNADWTRGMMVTILD